MARILPSSFAVSPEQAALCIDNRDLAAFEQLCVLQKNRPNRPGMVNTNYQRWALGCVKAGWLEGLDCVIRFAPLNSAPQVWNHASGGAFAHPSPLMLAARKNNAEMVQLLSEGVEANHLIAALSGAMTPGTYLILAEKLPATKMMSVFDRGRLGHVIYEEALCRHTKQDGEGLKRLVRCLNPLLAFLQWEPTGSNPYFSQPTEDTLPAWDRVWSHVTPDHGKEYPNLYQSMKLFFDREDVLPFCDMARSKNDKKVISAAIPCVLGNARVAKM